MTIDLLKSEKGAFNVRCDYDKILYFKDCIINKQTQQAKYATRPVFFLNILLDNKLTILHIFIDVFRFGRKACLFTSKIFDDETIRFDRKRLKIAPV